jgi:imidazolonepropionase-like amidohydrolase
MRHLNQEAAKLVKYCGFTEEEALHAITLNPAKQLGLDARLGTVEVGKDADLAIFNGHPLNSFTRCEMTLVEGEVFFQRADKLAPLAAAKDGPAKPAAKFSAIPEMAKGTYALTGGTVHQPGKAPFRGHVVVDAATGKITHVIRGEQFGVVGVARQVDCTGLHIYPGMIEAGTVLGLVEVDSARESNDSRDGGDFQPDLRASIGINPDSELIPVARANGITTVLTRPTGSLMPGQGALINLAGWVPAEMVVVDPVALHIEYPSAPTGRGFGPPNVVFEGGDSNLARFRREEKLNKLKELFETARRYDATKKAGAAFVANPRLESLLPYVRGEKPVIFTADRKADIAASLKLADELKVKPIISGGIEAWKLAPELKRRDVPVILGPVMSLPRETGERYDAPFASAAKLHRAGVRFCLRSKEASNTRNLPYEAAMAVAYGLPPEEALKAVTLYPAEILGVADKLGTVEEGKRANLVIASGDILQVSTQVLSVFIDGRPYEPTSKQTRLFDKYQKRLSELRSGPTPGGRP